MRKKYIIIIGVVLVISIVGVLVIRKHTNITSLLIGDTLLDTYQKIYSVSSSKRVYTIYEDIRAKSENGKTYSLETALKNGYITIDELIDKSDSYDGFNDGGSVIYYYKVGEFTNKNFTLVTCNSSVENGDNHNIYIVPNDSKYADICKNISMNVED